MVPSDPRGRGAPRCRRAPVLPGLGIREAGTLDPEAAVVRFDRPQEVGGPPAVVALPAIVSSVSSVDLRSLAGRLSLRPHDFLKLGVIPDGLEVRVCVDLHVAAEADGHGLLQEVNGVVPVSQLGCDAGTI